MKNVDIISKVVTRMSKEGVVTPSAGRGAVSMEGYLKEKVWDSVFEIKTDANGVPFLFVKTALASQCGITMYRENGLLDMPSIYDGLPIDGVTIYWENGILKAQGGGGGTITEVTSAMVTSALGFTPYNADNFTKAKIKSTLGISDWALAESKPSYSYTEIGGTPDLSVYALKTSLSSYQPLISTTNKLAYSLVSGTPTSLKNPTSLTFGSKTYDGSEAKTINASDLGALTSHQTIYALTLQAGTFSAGKYTPNSAAKTINIPTTTAHISESGNLYFTNARAVSALSSTLASYVTLGDSQTITGAKNFTGGLSVNGGSLVYNASEGYWKLEGNLLVTGGVSMYNSGDSDIPSGGGGGSIDYPLSWSGFSSGSFDGSAAKTIYIPSKMSELTNDSGYALSSALSNYLPKSGGTISGSLIIDGSYKTDNLISLRSKFVDNDGACRIQYTDSNGEHQGYVMSGWGNLLLAHRSYNQIGVGDSGIWCSTNNGTTKNSIWHEGNFNPSDYLPKSGGTLAVDNGVTLKIHRKQDNSVPYIRFGQNDSNEFGEFGVDINGNLVFWALKSNNLQYNKWNIVLTSGNYSSYALPLTGGTIQKSSGTIFNANFTTDIFGYNPNYGVYIGGAANGKSPWSKSYWIYSGNDNNPNPSFGYGSTIHTIIHSGNIGSQSVSYASSAGDADTLDGKHLASGNKTYNRVPHVAGDGVMEIGKYIDFHNTNDEANDYSTRVDCTASYKNTVHLPSTTGTLALTTDNVASATKLQTRRTIWGQGFDGSGNVSGSMTEVSNITMSGDIIMNNNMGVAIKNTNGTHKWVLLVSTDDRTLVGTTELDSYIRGNNVNITYGASQRSGIYLNSSGSVGIGTTSPSYKLHVEGVIYAGTNIVSKGSIIADSGKDAVYFHGTGISWHNSSNSWTKDLFTYSNSNDRLSAHRALTCSNTLDVAGSTTLKSMSATSGSFSDGLTVTKSTNNVASFKSTNAIGVVSLLGNGTYGTRLDISNSKADATVISLNYDGTISAVTGSFSGDVSIGSNAIFANNKGICIKNTSGTAQDVVKISGSNNLVFGVGSSESGLNTYLDGNNVYIRYGTTHSIGLTLASSGQVTIAQYTTIKSGLSAQSLELSMTTPFIDFHYNSSTEDYTSRIIETASGVLTCTGQWKVNGALTTSSTLSVSSTSTFTGKTTHNGGLTIVGAESNDIYNVANGNGAITTNSAGPGSSIRNALNFQWYNTSWQIGNIRGGGSDSYGFGITSSNNNLRFRVTTSKVYCYGGLEVTGNVLTSGSITMNSMRSMKNIINENGLSLEELSTIKPTRFTWKDGRDDRIHVGGIADDVMKVLPEVVFKGNDGVLSMDYASAAFVMAASLIQPMTEHERRIANLERENALLKEEIRNLKSA